MYGDNYPVDPFEEAETVDVQKKPLAKIANLE